MRIMAGLLCPQILLAQLALTAFAVIAGAASDGRPTVILAVAIVGICWALAGMILNIATFASWLNGIHQEIQKLKSLRK